MDHISLRDIAILVGVSKSTVENWSSRESWVGRRKLIDGEAHADYIRENIKTQKMKTSNITDVLHDQLYEIVAERQLWMDGKLGKKKYRFSGRDLIITAKTVIALRHGDLG